MAVRGITLSIVLTASTAAVAATNLGSNFDGNMTLIYDNVSGNVLVENGPLPNPAVTSLLIKSASGQLIPGNFNMPPLSPPLTVLSSTPTEMLYTWTSGPWLGTGKSLGNILPTGIPIGPGSPLFADLTIEWGAGPTLNAIGDLITGTYGFTQGNPVMPNTGANGFFRFFNVQTGQFFDPPYATGFEYTMTSASLFTKVGLPIGHGNSFDIYVNNVAVATNLPAGGAFNFPGPGVPGFTITGISPAVDAALGDAFPTYLEFSTPTASFNMQAVPEPALIGSLLAASTGLLLRRRQNGSAIATNSRTKVAAA